MLVLKFCYAFYTMEQPPFSFLRSLHWFCLDSLIIGICSYPSKSWWNSGPYLQLQHTSLPLPPYPNPVLPLNELPISNCGLPILRCLCPVCRFLLLPMQHSPTQPLQVFDHQAVPAGEGAQHKGNHGQGAPPANPLKSCHQNSLDYEMNCFQETIKEEKASILDASESDRESNTDTSESGKSNFSSIYVTFRCRQLKNCYCRYGVHFPDIWEILYTPEIWP